MFDLSERFKEIVVIEKEINWPWPPYYYKEDDFINTGKTQIIISKSNQFVIEIVKIAN